MESHDTEQDGFGFLNNSQVQRHFAELNIELLRGRHIMQSQPALYALLDEFCEPHLQHYYQALYGLQLEKRTHDGVTYFYLEFPQVGKGRLTNPNLYAEMDARTTLVACILANLYFSNFFSYDKKFQWEELKYDIEHGENREAYQRLLFGELRNDYTDKEWEQVKGQFRTAINFFHRIGLVEKEDADDTIHFTILPTIHRFIEMYQNEMKDIQSFLNELKL